MGDSMTPKASQQPLPIEEIATVSAANGALGNATSRDDGFRDVTLASDFPPVPPTSHGPEEVQSASFVSGNSGLPSGFPLIQSMNSTVTDAEGSSGGLRGSWNAGVVSDTPSVPEHLSSTLLGFNLDGNHSMFEFDFTFPHQGNSASDASLLTSNADYLAIHSAQPASGATAQPGPSGAYTSEVSYPTDGLESHALDPAGTHVPFVRRITLRLPTLSNHLSEPFLPLDETLFGMNSDLHNLFGSGGLDLPHGAGHWTSEDVMGDFQQPAVSGSGSIQPTLSAGNELDGFSLPSFDPFPPPDVDTDKLSPSSKSSVVSVSARSGALECSEAQGRREPSDMSPGYGHSISTSTVGVSSDVVVGLPGAQTHASSTSSTPTVSRLILLGVTAIYPVFIARRSFARVIYRSQRSERVK